MDSLKNKKGFLPAFLITIGILAALLIAGGAFIVFRTSSSTKAAAPAASLSSPDGASPDGASPDGSSKSAAALSAQGSDLTRDGSSLYTKLGIDAILRILRPEDAQKEMASYKDVLPKKAPPAKDKTTGAGPAPDDAARSAAAHADAAADKGAAAKDGEEAKEGSISAKETTSTAKADATTAKKDNSAAKADASAAKPGTSTAKKDNSAEKADTPAAKSGGSAEIADASAAKPGTSTAKKDNSAEKADIPAAKSGGSASKESASSEGTSDIEAAVTWAEKDRFDPEDSLTKLQKKHVRSWEELHGYPFSVNASLNDYDWDCLTYGEDGRLSYEGDDRYEVRRGIDVSEFQGEIDWKRVKKAGYDFAFIRAGYRTFDTGSINTDSRAVENLRHASRAGLDVGVYFFSQAVTKEEAGEEAQLCLDIIEKSGVEVTLPIAYDPEIQLEYYYARINSISRQQFTNNTISFCRAIKKAGYTPAIYANSSTETDILDMSLLDDAVIWYADYNMIPESPYRFTFWQYSDTGQVEGISEPATDLNLWFIEKSQEPAQPAPDKNALP